jgi:hypothetical protein
MNQLRCNMEVVGCVAFQDISLHHVCQIRQVAALKLLHYCLDSPLCFDRVFIFKSCSHEAGGGSFSLVMNGGREM